jgi:rhodanese-related sulfurtransferase
MKRLIIEIFIIVILASLIALIYNGLSNNPLPLIRVQKKLNEIEKDLIFDKKYETKEKDLGKTVPLNVMIELKDNPEVIIIDARTEENYSRGKIGNAINIYPYDDEQKMMESIFSLPQDKPIIVYCDGGSCDLSHLLAKNLLSLGFKRVFLYAGGWEEWSQKIMNKKY